MKLNEIKNVLDGDYALNEGVIPHHLTMSLQQVIDESGKISNNVQYFIIAGLMSMFKDGGPYRWPRDLNAYPMSTSSDVIEAVKSLAAGELVEMSHWLLGKLAEAGSFEALPNCSATPANTAEWMRWVIKRQD